MTLYLRNTFFYALFMTYFGLVTKKIKIGVCGAAQNWIIAFFVGTTVKKSNFSVISLKVGR